MEAIMFRTVLVISIVTLVLAALLPFAGAADRGKAKALPWAWGGTPTSMPWSGG